MKAANTKKRREPRPRLQADVDLEKRIANFLHHRHCAESDRIRAKADVGTVVISGRISSRREKQFCLNCCQRVAGVVRLIDRLKVTSAGAGA